MSIDIWDVPEKREKINILIKYISNSKSKKFRNTEIAEFLSEHRKID